MDGNDDTQEQNEKRLINFWLTGLPFFYIIVAVNWLTHVDMKVKDAHENGHRKNIKYWQDGTDGGEWVSCDRQAETKESSRSHKSN